MHGPEPCRRGERGSGEERLDGLDRGAGRDVVFARDQTRRSPVDLIKASCQLRIYICFFVREGGCSSWSQHGLTDTLCRRKTSQGMSIVMTTGNFRLWRDGAPPSEGRQLMINVNTRKLFVLLLVSLSARMAGREREAQGKVILVVRMKQLALRDEIVASHQLWSAV